jgi:hypothetical protein
VNLGEIAMAAAITVSVAGASYIALYTPAVTGGVRATAAKATCLAVDEAIVAYVAVYDRAPAAIADLTPFVDGDIAAYRIEKGLAAGPGCRT